MKIVLHKYMSVEGLKALLTYHSIKLSFGYEANDCFEMLQGDAVPSSNERTAAVEKHGFISLSARNDSPYMWGNYADHYKGARIDFVFEVEKDKKLKKRYFRIDKDKPRDYKLIDIDKIDFEGAYIDKCEYEINRIDKVDKRLEKCTRNIISNKERSWAQEEEYRIIYSISSAGRPSPIVSSSASSNGIIYTTRDINHCIYKIALGPLCEISREDVVFGLQSDASLRGVAVERLDFNCCEYGVRPILKDDKKDKTDILYLCRRRKIEQVNTLISKEPDKTKILDNFGSNCLDYAIRCKSEALVESLIAKNAKICNLSDSEAGEALIWSAQKNIQSLANVLFAKFLGKNIEQYVDNHYRNAMMYAAKNGNLEVFKLIFEYSKKHIVHFEEYLNKRDIDGRTALMLAAHGKNVAIVKSLLDAGAMPDMRDNDGSTAVFFAASGPRSDEDNDSAGEIILKLLAIYGAQLDITEDHGAKPIDYAYYNARIKCAFFLHGKTKLIKDRLLHFASGDLRVAKIRYSHDKINSYLEGIGELVSAGKTELDEEQVHQLFNIYNYVRGEDSGEAKEFISALLNACVNHEHTLAIYAAREGNIDFFIDLHEHCSKDANERNFVNITSKKGDKGGCTAFMWCISNPEENSSSFENCLKCLTFLLDHITADSLDIQDKSGCTALIWAARKGNLKAIDIILTFAQKHSKNISELLNAHDGSGMTMLMWAAWKKKPKVLKHVIDKHPGLAHDLLLETDNENLNVLNWAANAKDEDSLRFLLNLKHNGKNAYQFARVEPFEDEELPINATHL